MTNTPFVHLDFKMRGYPQDGLFFAGFDHIISTRLSSEVLTCLARLDEALTQGYHAVGFIAYEAATGLDPTLRTHPPHPELPLLWFGLCRQLPSHTAPPPAQTSRTEYHLGDWQPLMPKADYMRAYERIMQHIAAGDTYQVNMTFPMQSRFSTVGDNFHAAVGSFYADLKRAQAADYCAWIHTPDFDILSISPELFFELRDGSLTARPMKGTRPRGMTPSEDEALRAELLDSAKDRAENVIIVDMLRNDLGRVAEFGSVRVPALFDAERYPTIWQLTSTVQAKLRPGVGLVGLLQALFPCGSITGAPKVRTMEIITAQERAPRGVYCGSVGYLAPGGEAVFNVAIRTVTIFPDGRATYHVGSGLVADSQSTDEYEECLLKAQVLRSATGWPDFQILESLLFEPENGFYLLSRHLVRLHQSATYFGFACDLEHIRARLLSAAANWPGTHTVRRKVRLLLHRDGTIELQSQPLEPRGSGLPMRVALAAQPVNSRNPFLYHKTTHRTVYEQAQATRGSADTVLLYNERGELTESVSANVAVQLGGQWWTPAVQCGLLAGTLRAELLARGALKARVIHIDELARSTGIKLMNSVRGEFEVELIASLKPAA